jgi:hypothetical protein
MRFDAKGGEMKIKTSIKAGPSCTGNGNGKQS